MLVDLRGAADDLTGADAEKWLEAAGIDHATRTASPTTRARRRSPAACAWARPR